MNDNTPELKMWLIVRSDIDIPAAKLAVQAGHGFCTTMMKAFVERKEILVEYMANSQPKIIVSAKNEVALGRAYSECIIKGIPSSIITDEGRTIFDGPTKTVVAVGPCYADDLPKYVKRMQLYKG